MPGRVPDVGEVVAALGRPAPRHFKSMISACFRAFDTAILLDSLEADRENVRAGDELDSGDFEGIFSGIFSGTKARFRR
jgi:hypothetical protein